MKKILSLTLICVIIAYLLSIIIFWGSPEYLIIPLIAGLLIAVIQKQNASRELTIKLLLSSLFFGFAVMLLTEGLFYLRESSLGYRFNFSNFLVYSLIFSLISFIGNLIGIGIKKFRRGKIYN